MIYDRTKWLQCKPQKNSIFCWSFDCTIGALWEETERARERRTRCHIHVIIWKSELHFLLLSLTKVESFCSHCFVKLIDLMKIESTYLKSSGFHWNKNVINHVIRQNACNRRSIYFIQWIDKYITAKSSDTQLSFISIRYTKISQDSSHTFVRSLIRVSFGLITQDCAMCIIDKGYFFIMCENEVIRDSVEEFRHIPVIII